MSATHCDICGMEWSYHGTAGSSGGGAHSTPPPCSPFLALTLQGLRTLIQRLDDVDGSVLTTMETARHAGEMELFGKLSMTATTILAIRERYKAILEVMENAEVSESEEYQRFVASMVPHCHCRESNRPCDGVLAGGLCDNMQDEPENSDYQPPVR